MLVLKIFKRCKEFQLPPYLLQLQSLVTLLPGRKDPYTKSLRIDLQEVTEAPVPVVI